MRDTATNKVDFVPDILGKWEVSLILKDSERSLFRKVENPIYPEYKGSFEPVPTNNSFITGADPFKFRKKQFNNQRMSDGGIAIFWERNNQLDPLDKIEDFKDWHSHRFVADYLDRPDKDVYLEQVLCACIYYGAKIYFENNIEGIEKYFIDEGFGGYLMHYFDVNMNIYTRNPGYHANETNKQDIFTNTRSYIEHHICKDRHIRILKEYMDIPGIEEMGNYDLFAAQGGCQLAMKSQYTKVVENIDTSMDVTGFYNM